MPYRNLTAALVLDDVQIIAITDFGTSYTTPEYYLDHLVGFGLFTTDGQPPGELRPVPLERARRPSSRRSVRRSPRTTASVAAMDRAREDPLRGVRVLLLPPAVRRGGRRWPTLDWTVPRDIPGPLYELVSAMEGDNAGVDDDGPYYAPLA